MLLGMQGKAKRRNYESKLLNVGARTWFIVVAQEPKLQALPQCQPLCYWSELHACEPE